MDRIISYAEALHEAACQEMERDPSIFIMGIGADDFKGIYGSTTALAKKFGPSRVFDTPLSEDAMTGIAIGAALSGLRPIHIHIRMDFLLLSMNQIINMAAKMRSMYGGNFRAPIVIRAIIGKSWGQGAQHSQGLHAFFMHVPGLKVFAPATPADAKGCLIQALREPDPVVLIEHMLLHKQIGPVPQESYCTPFGKTHQRTKGRDITLVGISWMAVECLRAQKILQDKGIEAEVLDPVSLSPLDIETILTSVRKTRNLLVADTAWTSCGASAEILARVAENFSGIEEIQVKRMGFAPVNCPTAPNLENLFYPNAETIARQAFQMIRPGQELDIQPTSVVEAAPF